MSKRNEIAAKVLGKLQQREAGTEPAARPRTTNTFIGQVGEQMTQGYAARVEQLERERQEGGVILTIDPKQIRRAAQANRHVLSLHESDEDFVALKQSLKRDGQIMPISVRAIEGEAGFSYELVSGHRRHEAALQLDRELSDGFRIKAVLDSAARDPVALALHMYLENAARKDLSAYELGAMFRTWIESGIFQQQQEIAEATGLGKPTISKYLQVAGLPAEILEAFGDPRVIAVRWAETLIAALKANEPAVLAAAKKLAEREVRPAPESILRQLTGAGVARKADAAKSQPESVEIDGRVAFSYSVRDGKIAIRFSNNVDESMARQLTDEIKELLKSRLKDQLVRNPQ